MEPDWTARILILAHDAPVGRRWADWLQPHDDCLVWCGRGEMPEATWPEVVLLEGDFPVELVDARDGTLSGDLEVGFLRVGGNEPADVQIPQDATPRELHLACRLLAEIVRLRRQVRSGSEAHRRMAYQALTDPLTGLPNRRAWDAGFAGRLAVVADSTSSLCLAILDIDHFKRINDEHGHAAGDEVLKGVGRAFCESLRHDDFVARLGGDEFGLLMWLPDRATAAPVVERVRVRVTREHRAIEGVTVTASAGFHVISAGSPLPSPAVLLATADTALREAKRLGRDRTAEG